MRIVFSLVLLTGFAQLSQGVPENPQPDKTPVLKANAVFPNALKQVTTASPKLGHEVAKPVGSLRAGLLQLKKISDRPILAMAEKEGWFFYATAVARDGNTGAPVSMISGYAIKRDGRRVIA